MTIKVVKIKKPTFFYPVLIFYQPSQPFSIKEEDRGMTVEFFRLIVL
jgi:hypothetical protein